MRNVIVRGHTRVQSTLVTALCLVLGACAGPTDAASTTDAGSQFAETKQPLSRTPFAIVPASAETLQETGVEKWTMHHLDSNTTTIAGWNNHKLQSFVRIRYASDGTLHLDYGKEAGVVVLNDKGQFVSGYAGPKLQERASAISHFGRDISESKIAPYDCQYAVITGMGGILVAYGTCMTMMAAGPLAPEAVAACLGAQMINYAGTREIGLQCPDNPREWLKASDDGGLVVECEGSGCGSDYPDVFEDAGAEGTGGTNDGSGGTGGDDPGDPDGDGPISTGGGPLPGGGLGET